MKIREMFRIEVRVEDKAWECLLFHEFSLEPSYKQVQLIEDGRTYRYDIMEQDERIISQIPLLIEGDQAK